MNDLRERYFSMQCSLFPMVEEEIGERHASGGDTDFGFTARQSGCNSVPELLKRNATGKNQDSGGIFKKKTHRTGQNVFATQINELSTRKSQ